MVPRKKLTAWQNFCGLICWGKEKAAKYPKAAMLVAQIAVTGFVGSGAVVGYSKLPRSPEPVEQSVVELLKEIKADVKEQKAVTLKQGEQLGSLERGFRRQTKILARYPGIKRVIQSVDEEEEVEQGLRGETASTGRHSERVLR